MAVWNREKEDSWEKPGIVVQKLKNVEKPSNVRSEEEIVWRRISASTSPFGPCHAHEITCLKVGEIDVSHVKNYIVDISFSETTSESTEISLTWPER